jgi:hypothetical protein
MYSVLYTIFFVLYFCYCKHWVVGGLEWSNDPKSYAGGSVATGRTSHAGKVNGDDPD